MQVTRSTITSWAFLLLVTDVEVAKTDINFLPLRFNTLIVKMALFVIIVIGNLTQVFVIFLWWPVTNVPCQQIGCLNSNS